MNERIRELLVEAGVYECDDFEPHPTFEKFAELILKQCLSYVEDSFGDVDYVKFMIKRDFGVKE